MNKLQAKMASPVGKPGGVTVLPPERFLPHFGAREVGVIPGVGPKTVEALARLGIRTVGDLAGADPGRLKAVFGMWAALLRGHARGEDAASVTPSGREPAPRSAGHESTFARDVADPAWLSATVWLLADRVARRLRRHRMRAAVAAVRFKIGAKRYSRQRRLAQPTDEAAVLAAHSWRLLEAARGGRSLRLVGVAGMTLVAAPAEAPMFDHDRRRRTLISVGDRLRDRFGEEAILPAGVFLRGERRAPAGRERLLSNPERRRSGP